MTSKLIYCTYVTFYSGNKLPPFYIGSSSVKRIESGYRGSVSSKLYKKIFRSELKDNPHLFKTKIISVHETRSEAYIKENKLHRHLNVVDSSMYINQHIVLSPNFASGPMSDDTKLKISKTTKGRPKSKQHSENISKGKKGIATKVGIKDSPESNIKRSIAMSGRSQPRHTCPHCNLIGGNAMLRWHFDNCPQNQNISNV